MVAALSCGLITRVLGHFFFFFLGVGGRCARVNIGRGGFIVLTGLSKTRAFANAIALVYSSVYNEPAVVSVYKWLSMQVLRSFKLMYTTVLYLIIKQRSRSPSRSI